MKNYNIYHDGKVIKTIKADENYSSSETGQTTFWEANGDKLSTVAIVPKEFLIIKTEDLTEYYQKLQDIISDLEDVGFNDIERKLPNFKDYQQCMEIKRQSLLSYFREKLNE